MKKNIDYSDIFAFTEWVMLATDGTGRVIHATAKACELLKLEREAAEGSLISDFLPETGRRIRDTLTSGEAARNLEVREVLGELSVDVMPVSHGNGVIGAVCDFHRVGTTAACSDLSLSVGVLNNRLQTIFDSSSDGLWVCDGQGKVLSINKASEHLNGIKAREVIGFTVFQLLEKKVFDNSVTTRVIESGKRETVTQYISKTNRSLLSTGTPAVDEEGNIVLIVVNERDMTELNSLRHQIEENQKVKEKYEEELSELSLLELERNTIIAESSRMRQVLQMALKLSRLGASNILILGESGTGKGLLAKLIHRNSKRHRKPFVEINCAALPENLLEAELFGYEPGAFTGADRKGRVGLFEMARGGTVFLDEMGDMPLALQSKILKYFDNQEIRRVGGRESKKVNCTVISATNQDLSRLVREKRFREDLYYRLSSFIVEVPPLRKRRDDIAGFVRFYLNAFNTQYGCKKTISPATIGLMQNYTFPGNIRELKSIMENAVVVCDTDRIDDFIRSSVFESDGSAKEREGKAVDGDPIGLTERIEELEHRLLREARKKFRTTRAMAEALGISQPSVVRKLRKYTID